MGRCRRVRQLRLERIRDYCGPEPGTAAFHRKPFSGRLVRQRLATGVWIEGRLLVSQCNAHTQNGQRCRRTTSCDYQWCSWHLLRQWHLLLASSHIPRAGRGVFAVDADTLRRLGRDEKKRPYVAPDVIVFEKDAPIGNGFGGEFVSSRVHDKRYGQYRSAYALSWYRRDGKESPTCYVDGFVARTISSYCNDAINVHKKSDWPFRNNAYWRGDTLLALRPIHHGEEILWSYGNAYWNS